MINYIRANNCDPTEFIGGAVQSKWDDDIYLKPIIIDNWLMFGKLNIFSVLF